MDPKTIPVYFESRLEEIVKAIFEIVEIESPSYGVDGIRRVADWIENEARESFEDPLIERIPAEGFGEHMILRTFRHLGGKPILILGHTDTVHPIGSKKKNPTRVENGNLYGCGTFDMKANIVLMLRVFSAMKDLDISPARPINILLACDEEVGSETGRPIVEREAKMAEFSLVFEPSAAGNVKTGRKGTGGYVLKAQGIAAHAGLDPEKGASAILEISRQINALHDLNDLEAGTTVTVGKIVGGTATNVVPAEAECTIDVRFTTLDEASKIEKAIAGLRPFDERVTLLVSGEVNRPPMERTAGVVKLFEHTKALASSFDYELGETQVGGASDGNFVGALGIPVLDGLGIAGNGAHTLEEHVVVEDIPKRAALLTLLLGSDIRR